MRTHEGTGAPGYFVTIAIDQSCVGHKHPPFTTNPAALGYDRSVLERLGEEQIEGGGQDEAVGHQAIGRIKSGVVEHLEIGGPVYGPGCVIISFIDIE